MLMEENSEICASSPIKGNLKQCGEGQINFLTGN